MTRNVLDVTVSVMKNVKSTTVQPYSLMQYLTEPTDRLRLLVDQVRNTIDPGQKKVLKSKLPAILIGGEFDDQNTIVTPSNLMVIDIDLKDNPCLQNPEATKKLIMDHFPSVAYCGLSVGGGLYCIVHIGNMPTEITEYATMYGLRAKAFCRELIHHTGLKPDQAVVNVKNKRFISYDQSALFNISARTFEGVPAVLQSVHATCAPTFSKPSSTAESKFQVLEHAIEKDLGNGLGYSDWSKVAAGLYRQLGEDGRSYFHRLSCTDPRYNQAQCDRQFDKSKSYKEISFGTVRYILKC